MKAAIAFILTIFTAASPEFSTVSRAQLQSWLHACDLSQSHHENCTRDSCLHALKQLVKPDIHIAYEHLGMGSESDLNEYSRLYDICRLQSRDFITKKRHLVATNWTTNLLALKTYRDIHGHVRVPQRFVIPADKQKWPIESHGVK